MKKNKRQQPSTDSRKTEKEYQKPEMKVEKIEETFFENPPT